MLVERRCERVQDRTVMTATNVELFSPHDEASDHRWYRAARDWSCWHPIRLALESTWNDHHRVLAERPLEFLKDFRIHFPQRAWELYVLAWLKREQREGRLRDVCQAPKKGPDFCAISNSGHRLWIECIVPEAGDAGPQAHVLAGQPHWVGPSEPVERRFTSGLQEKLRKLKAYISKKIINADDLVFIAIGLGDIQDVDLHDDEVSMIARLVYGVGPGQIVVPIWQGAEEEVPFVQHPARDTIPSKSGAPIDTVFFRDDNVRAISGVLYSRRQLHKMLDKTGRIVLAHNPRATRPACGLEWRLEGTWWTDTDGLLCSEGDVRDDAFEIAAPDS